MQKQCFLATTTELKSNEKIRQNTYRLLFTSAVRLLLLLYRYAVLSLVVKLILFESFILFSSPLSALSVHGREKIRRVKMHCKDCFMFYTENEESNRQLMSVWLLRKKKHNADYTGHTSSVTAPLPRVFK